MIDQTIHLFPKKRKLVPTKFRKRFLYNSEHNKVLNIIVDG